MRYEFLICTKSSELWTYKFHFCNKASNFPLNQKKSHCTWINYLPICIYDDYKQRKQNKTDRGKCKRSVLKATKRFVFTAVAIIQTKVITQLLIGTELKSQQSTQTLIHVCIIRIVIIQAYGLSYFIPIS